MLLQGSAPKNALLEEFRLTPNAVLFATSSFWQGVDVQGEQLSCVIIDRLPFAVPNDPVVAARIGAINSAGGTLFLYQVPAAVIALKQGFGRLIRSVKDRGVLALLDNRLLKQRYGRTFIDSLPAYKKTKAWRTWKYFLPAQKVCHPDGCCRQKSYFFVSASSSFSDAAAALFKAGFFPLDARACKDVIAAFVLRVVAFCSGNSNLAQRLDGVNSHISMVAFTGGDPNFLDCLDAGVRGLDGCGLQRHQGLVRAVDNRLFFSASCTSGNLFKGLRHTGTVAFTAD